MNRLLGFGFFVALVLCANAFPPFVVNNQKFQDDELFEIKLLVDGADTVGYLEFCEFELILVNCCVYF